MILKTFLCDIKCVIKELFASKKRLFIFPITIFIISIILGIVWQTKSYIPTLKPINYSFFQIFQNNLKQNSIIFLAGFVTFGVGSSLILMFNGFVIGSTIYITYYKHGIIPILTGILPHASFELLATFIIMVLSYGSLRFIKKIFKSNKKQRKSINYKNYIIRKVYKYVI